jgi:hypothetical protein
MKLISRSLSRAFFVFTKIYIFFNHFNWGDVEFPSTNISLIPVINPPFLPSTYFLCCHFDGRIFFITNRLGSVWMRSLKLFSTIIIRTTFQFTIWCLKWIGLWLIWHKVRNFHYSLILRFHLICNWLSSNRIKKIYTISAK